MINGYIYAWTKEGLGDMPEQTSPIHYVLVGKTETSSQQPDNSTRDSGYFLKQDKFRLEIKGNLFHHESSPEWNRLSRKAVWTVSSEVFKTRLEKALSHMV